MLSLPRSVERSARCSDVLHALSRLEGGDVPTLGAQDFDRQMYEQLLQAMSRLHAGRIKGDADHLPVDVLEEASCVKADRPNA